MKKAKHVKKKQKENKDFDEKKYMELLGETTMTMQRIQSDLVDLR